MAGKAVVAAATLVVFALVGTYIFVLFSITIPAFRTPVASCCSGWR